MPISDVDKVAQGRVWDGAKAKELGLVDELGGMKEAVLSAAELAGLKNYSPIYLQQTIPPSSEMFENFRWWSNNTFSGLHSLIFSNSKFLQNIRNQMSLITLQGDPANIYAHSLIPRSYVAY